MGQSGTFNSQYIQSNSLKSLTLNVNYKNGRYESSWNE
ncbi:hypothetical protein MIR68_007656 [Amoeboaphelidium protococcarum]|nr:hypothetical protein MIR68_007656 [Amoeboaphelidium protococcarum]